MRNTHQNTHVRKALLGVITLPGSSGDMMAKSVRFHTYQGGRPDDHAVGRQVHPGREGRRGAELGFDSVHHNNA